MAAIGKSAMLITYKHLENFYWNYEHSQNATLKLHTMIREFRAYLRQVKISKTTRYQIKAMTKIMTQVQGLVKHYGLESEQRARLVLIHDLISSDIETVRAQDAKARKWKKENTNYGVVMWE